MSRDRRDELERALGELEFPGEGEELRRRAESAALGDAVMARVRREMRGVESPGESAESQTGRVPWYWLVAALANLFLLFFFAFGSHPAASLIMDSGAFYPSMVFLFLGMSTCVSLIGTAMTADIPSLRRIAAGLRIGM